MKATILCLWTMLGGLALLAGCGSGQQETSSAPPAPAHLSPSGGPDAFRKDDDVEPAVAVAVAVEPAAKAPFGLSYLDADTELFVFARPSAVVASPFVQALSGGKLGPLDAVKEAIGIGIEQVDTVTVGVRNLQKLTEQNRRAFAGGPMGLAMGSRGGVSTPANAADDTIVVVRTIELLTPEALGLVLPGGDSEERLHQSQRYFPLPTGATPRPFLYFANETTLVIASEDAVKKIIEQGEKISQPRVDLSFIPSATDVVLAVVPKDRKALFAAAPGFGPAVPGSPNSPFGPNAPGAPVNAGKGKALSLLGNKDEDDEDEDGFLSSGPNAQFPVTPQPQQEDFDALLEAHAEAVALLLDFEADLKLDVAVRCDSPAAAAKVRAVLAKTVTSLKESLESARDTLPGVIQQIADAVLATVQTGGSDRAVTLSATLPESQQTNLTMLPIALMGMMMGGGGMQNMEAMVDWQQRAQDVVDQGKPPVSAESLPAGLELRGLARWGVPPSGGDKAAAPLEVAIAATGELAGGTVEIGELRLTELDVGAGPRLKWLGAVPSEAGETPVGTFVSIDREGFFSRHPTEGFATGYLFAAAGNLPAALPTIAGTLTLKAATNVRDVTLDRLPAPGGTVADDTLRASGFAVNTATENGVVSVTFTYESSPTIGEIELLGADGSPLTSAAWSKMSFGGQVLHTIHLPAETDPSQLGVRVSVLEDVQQIPVPFRFENLTLPQPQDVSPEQQQLAMWTPHEQVSGEFPAGLIVEAQARWHAPQMNPFSPSSGGPANGPFAGLNPPPTAFGGNQLLQGGLPSGGGGDRKDRDRSSGGRNRRERDEDEDDGGGFGDVDGVPQGAGPNAGQDPGSGKGGLSLFQNDDDEDFPALGTAFGAATTTVNADGSLQLAVDLTGPLAKSIVAVGQAAVDTAESAEGDDLAHTGSLYAGSNLAVGWVDVTSETAKGLDQPPDGLRILVLFTPPEPPIESIARFRGTLQIRSAREQVEAIVNNLNDRTNRRIKDRNLGKYGLEIAVLIEDNQLMFRLLEGNAERIADMYPVDRDGEQIADIVHSTTLDNGNLLHRFEFPGRVPSRVGLKFSINLGVQEIELPLRFRDVPVPPRPAAPVPSIQNPLPAAPIPNPTPPGAGKFEEDT